MGWMSKVFGATEEEPVGPEAAHKARLEAEKAAAEGSHVPEQKKGAAHVAEPAEHKTTAHKAAEPKAAADKKAAAVPAQATEHTHAAAHKHPGDGSSEAADSPHEPTASPTHPTKSKGTGVTLEHNQMLTVHIMTHVPDHAPRTDDPHYHLFEQAKARLKKQGMWKCIIDDDLCDGGAELHHTHVEFSQINQVDESKIIKALGLHFESDEEFQAWAESPGNLEVLCANHHRAHYGIHMIPGPLWEALRFHKTGTGPAAEFVPAGEADADVKAGKASAADAATSQGS